MTVLWLLVTAAGVALLVAFPALRRARGRLLARVGLAGDFRRFYERASDVCVVFIGVAWTVVGVIELLRG